MKVSTRVEYGVLALADIAMYSEKGSSVPAMEIAQREGISKKYLEQILHLLRQGGLISAQKGLRGGYSLIRSADKITMAEVLNALDNSILEEMQCPLEDTGINLRYAINDCLWGQLNRFWLDFSGDLSLSDFLGRCMSMIESGADMYVI